MGQQRSFRNSALSGGLPCFAFDQSTEQRGTSFIILRGGSRKNAFQRMIKGAYLNAMNACGPSVPYDKVTELFLSTLQTALLDGTVSVADEYRRSCHHTWQTT
jgi:hypothetical protein